MWTDEEIKGKVLHKLTRRGKFQHSHTSIDNLPKGFPAHERKRVKKLVNEMRREELLLSKPTSYGREVSINLGKKDEVYRLIEVFLKKR